eukprot:2720101-Amphidinium_carterae.1
MPTGSEAWKLKSTNNQAQIDMLCQEERLPGQLPTSSHKRCRLQNFENMNRRQWQQTMIKEYRKADPSKRLSKLAEGSERKEHGVISPFCR